MQLKRDSNAGVFLWILQKKNFRTLPVAASAYASSQPQNVLIIS